MVWKYLIESNTFQVIYGIIYTQESRIFCYPDDKMNYFATYKKLYEYIIVSSNESPLQIPIHFVQGPVTLRHLKMLKITTHFSLHKMTHAIAAFYKSG